MSSCFPISLSCFARRAVHYEAVSVSSGCSASLIKLGQGLISFSTWTEKNLHIWCKGHFVLLALSAECTSVACWFFFFFLWLLQCQCPLLSFSLLYPTLQETPNKLYGVKRARWLLTCGAPQNYRSSRVMGRCEIHTPRVWCCPHL